MGKGKKTHTPRGHEKTYTPYACMHVCMYVHICYTLIRVRRFFRCAVDFAADDLAGASAASFSPAYIYVHTHTHTHT